MPVLGEHFGCVQGVKDRAECQKHCESTPNCNAAVLSTVQKDGSGQPMCFPKNVPLGSNILPNAVEGKDYIELCPAPEPPKYTPPPPQPDEDVQGAACGEWMQHHDRFGKGDISMEYSKRKVSSHEECLDLCKATPGAL